MSIGPVQLMVVGFRHPDFRGEIVAELDSLRENDAVRLLDALAVYKDEAGDISVIEASDLTEDEAVELGGLVGALIGLDGEGGEAIDVGAIAGAEQMLHRDNFFTEEDVWDVIAAIPEDSAAALLLVEHRWAIPLRDAIARAGGFRIASGVVSPLDLVEIGLISAEEADTIAG